MTPKSRRWIGALVRYGVCIAAVGYLVVDTEWSQLKEVLATARGNWHLLIASVLAFGPAPLIISLRLKLLLDVHQVQLSTWQVIKYTFAGNFLITSLPILGTGGGDAAKAWYVARDTPHKHEAVTTVFFDRVLGVMGLVGLASVVLLVNWRNPIFSQWSRIIGLLAGLMVVGGGVYFSDRMRRLLRLEKLVRVLPFASHIERIDRAAYTFRHHPGRLAVGMLLTFLLQVEVIVSLWLAGWALGLVGGRPLASLPVYLGYTPICLLAGAFPIGVMEQIFRQLLSDAAGLGSPEAAYSLSLFGRIIQLTWALPGALVVLSAGRPRSGPNTNNSTPETELTVPY
jgi:hypothetical protein